ncbi:MAG: hypothetical protein ACXAC7_00785 [Candidatus Hodarchaeales archaeon]|jgi:hypothetical protein
MASTSTVDEKDILIISSAGDIVFQTGKGRLIKSKRIVTSLTQALVLFSQKIINEPINFVRFQNQKMFFINEADLFAVRIVPKDQLAKQFAPAMRSLTKFINMLYNEKPELISNFQEPLSYIYRLLFHKPEKTLFIISGDLDGYSALMVLLAGLAYDLHKDLDSFDKNFIIVKAEDNYSFIYPDNELEGIFSIGVSKSDLQLDIDLPFIDFKQINIGFNTMLPSTLTPADLLGLLFGDDSSATKIQDLVHNQDVQEVTMAFNHVPTGNIIVETVKEAIYNYPKDNRLGKPMYRILIRRLRELEPDAEIDKKFIIDFSDKKTETPTSEPSSPVFKAIPPTQSQSVEKIDVAEKQESELIHSDQQEISESDAEIGSFDRLSEAFENQLDSLSSSTSTTSTQEYIISKIIDNDVSTLEISQYSILLDSSQIFIDARPYITNEELPVPKYAPSIQIAPQRGENVIFSIILTQGRNPIYETLLEDIAKLITGTINQIPRGFTLTISKQTFYVAFRSLVWSLIVEYAALVQEKLRPKTNILDIPNEGSICIIDILTPERRQQLPSQIVEIHQEEELIKEFEIDDNPVRISQSIDALLKKLSNPLRYGHGVGLVLRENSLELPLIMQFILTLSEICGIGWSRW